MGEVYQDHLTETRIHMNLQEQHAQKHDLRIWVGGGVYGVVGTFPAWVLRGADADADNQHSVKLSKGTLTTSDLRLCGLGWPSPGRCRLCTSVCTTPRAWDHSSPGDIPHTPPGVSTPETRAARSRTRMRHARKEKARRFVCWGCGGVGLC